MDEVDSMKFLENVFHILKEEHAWPGEDVPVINFKHPKELEDQINFNLEDTVPDLNTFENLCRDIIKYSVKTSHTNFRNQLYGGVDKFGLGGTWISEALNTNQHTYEVAPTFTLSEQAVLKHVRQTVGYTQGDGIFSPGGSISNMYGMVLARYKAFPYIKSKGNCAAPPLVAYTSEEAHYSIKKAVHWLGIGTDNLVSIRSNREGKMISEDLEQKILETKANGKIPFFVNATAGTTVLGAIDPLNEIADICKKYDVWFHVDACFGGTLMLSKKYQQRLNGLNRSDSLAWNPHKMLGAPLQCAIFLTQHDNLLHQCNSASAAYLFQQDKFYDMSYDTGDKSIQCGRKVDAFKLWLMWKARGNVGFEKLVDNTMECAIYFKNKISNHEGFRLILNDYETTCICFFYIPPSMRRQKEDDYWYKKLNLVAPAIKEKLLLDGTLMIGYTPLWHKNLCNFFRLVTTCQPPPSLHGMDFIISQIEKYGKEL